MNSVEEDDASVHSPPLKVLSNTRIASLFKPKGMSLTQFDPGTVSSSVRHRPDRQ